MNLKFFHFILDFGYLEGINPIRFYKGELFFSGIMPFKGPLN